jgi:hypothetical protein
VHAYGMPPKPVPTTICTVQDSSVVLLCDTAQAT